MAAPGASSVWVSCLIPLRCGLSAGGDSAMRLPARMPAAALCCELGCVLSVRCLFILAMDDICCLSSLALLAKWERVWGGGAAARCKCDVLTGTIIRHRQRCQAIKLCLECTGDMYALSCRRRRHCRPPQPAGTGSSCALDGCPQQPLGGTRKSEAAASALNAPRSGGKWAFCPRWCQEGSIPHQNSFFSHLYDCLLPACSHEGCHRCLPAAAGRR